MPVKLEKIKHESFYRQQIRGKTLSLTLADMEIIEVLHNVRVHASLLREIDVLIRDRNIDRNAPFLHADDEFLLI